MKNRTCAFFLRVCQCVSGRRPNRVSLFGKTVAVAALLVAMLLGLHARAQVYVGGVQSTITGPFTGETDGSWDGPVGVASDSSGNIYISNYPDTGVYEINATTRAVTTYIAPGTLVCGYALSETQLMATDTTNNLLYITDAGNNRIVEWSLARDSCVTTYTVANAFAVLVDSSGNLWYGTWSGTTGTVGEIVDGTPTTKISSGLGGVTGMVFDSAGNLYVSSLGSSATGGNVYKYAAPDYTSQSTIVSNAETPYSLYFDANGNLDVAEANLNSVLKYFASTDFTTDIQLAPSIPHAEGFGADKFGNLYMTAYVAGAGTVTEISPAGAGFGQVSVGTTSSPVAVNFSIASGTTIGSFKVVEQGGAGLEFAAQNPNTSTTPCTTGAHESTTTCSVNVTFAPQSPGLRMGAVEALDGSGNVLATASISGTGVAPQVAFTPGTINTLAGNGTAGYAGDTGAATSAEVDVPSALVVDSAGNLYIADYANNVIRVVASGKGSIPGIPSPTAGDIYTVAGGGSPTSGDGDGGVATSAALSGPDGLAVDGAGDLYIAEYGGNRVREVNAAGDIATVVGTGTACASPTSTPACGDGGLATSAELTEPIGLAFDSAGDLYISDNGDARIREVNAVTGNISTVAGDGTAGFSGDNGSATSAEMNGPDGLAVDGAGNLYIASYANDDVRVVASGSGSLPGIASPVAGDIYTVAGQDAAGYSGDGGPATSAELSQPEDIALDSAGNLYIADRQNNRIREVAATTGIITTVVGNGTACPSPTPTPTPACGDTGAATSAEINTPFGIALDSAGNLYIAEYGGNRIREVNVSAVPTLSFPTTTYVGQTDGTDPAQTVTVSNIGNASLTFAAPPEGGSNPSYPANFPVNGDGANLCSSTNAAVAMGANCNVSANFAPTGAESNTGSITLTDNALNASSARQSISLSGTGVAPDTTTLTASANPSSAIYGQAAPVILGAVVTDTTNPGTTPTGTVTFNDSVNGNATTLGTETLTDGVYDFQDSTPAAGTHTVTISYTPSSTDFAASSSTVTFSVAAYSTLANFQVALANSPVYAGVGDTLTVTAEDQYGNVITNFSGPVTLTSTDSGAVLPTLTFSNGVGTGVVSFSTAGTQAVTVSGSGLSGTSNAVTVQATPEYMVTVATDTTTGVASDCTDQSLSGATPDENCSLRDAITAANAIQYAAGVTKSTNITFEPSVFGTAQTITLANGVLTLDSNISIVGPTTGSGVTQTNLLTVSGNQTSGIFAVESGVTAALSQLVLTKGAMSGGTGGAGIYNAGTLTVSFSTLSGNNAAYDNGGGGIYNAGTLTVSNSTFNGNSTLGPSAGGYIDAGGGIYNAGALTVSNSTFFGNSAVGPTGGGGIYNASSGTLTMTNSTVSGNSDSGVAGTRQNPNGGGIYNNGGSWTLANSIVAGNAAGVSGDGEGQNPDLAGGYTDDGGNQVGTSSSAINLAPLGNYGGPTQTMPPHSGSSALLAGTYRAGEPTTDQRGYARPTSGPIDSGAVQVSGSGAAVTSISPAGGSPVGGNTVTITGTSFTGATAVMFGGVPATSFTVNSDTSITATAPAASAGTVDIEVVTPIGISAAVAADRYTFSAVTAALADPSLSLTESHTVTGIVPVNGTGGTAPLTYSISPGLPAGLTFSSSTGTITGTPTATSPMTSYTVTVTDANGATASAQFTLTVNGAVTATQTIASQSLTDGHTATAFTPVTGAGGTAPLTYSISPSLPAGLTFSSSTGTITGTPTATSPATPYTVTVTDADGATATAGFSLTVNSAVTATQNTASQSLTESHTVTGIVPVNSTGGTAPLTYSISPGLPAGLTFNPSTGTITGTPTATSPMTSYTVTVTDANGTTATAQFTLTVNGAVTATQTIASQSLTESHTTTAFTPVTGAGGTAPLTYSISPGLPAGLSFSSSTGTITGTPTATSPATSYTVTVTDADGATATAGFSLTVNSAVTATQNTASQSLTASQPVTPFTPVSSTGGTAPLTYSISPAMLPPGLTFNPSTGTITGTPTGASPTTTYTVTVTDANGATTSASFSLTVNGAVTATQNPAPPTLTYGQTTSFTPVNGTGGTGSLTYTISPALPPGLTFNPSTGTITGTPTGASPTTTYTVTVTDANGAKTSTSFSLGVNQAGVSGVVLTSTVNPVLVDNTTTLVATVSSPVSTPTGTVSFFDGTSSTPLGSAALSGGVAQLPVSSLTVGTHSITAVYSGDTNFLGASSSAVNEQVEDFNLTIAPTSSNTSGTGSSGTGAPGTSATVSPGGTANYGFTLTPTGTTTFVAPVTLSVVGLPPGATYTLTPTTIAAGAVATNVQLSVSLPSQTAALQHGVPFHRGLVSVALGMLLLPFSRRMRRTAGRFGRMAAVLLLLIASAAGIAGLTGCGSSTGYFAQPQQTYNVSVVATSGTLTHSTLVTLTVQ